MSPSEFNAKFNKLQYAITRAQAYPNEQDIFVNLVMKAVSLGLVIKPIVKNTKELPKPICKVIVLKGHKPTHFVVPYDQT